MSLLFFLQYGYLSLFCRKKDGREKENQNHIKSVTAIQNRVATIVIAAS